MINTAELIDLNWAEIEGEWVIYQDELNEWVRAHGKPHCPVCKDTKAGMRNIRMESNIKRGQQFKQVNQHIQSHMPHTVSYGGKNGKRGKHHDNVREFKHHHRKRL